VAITIRRLRSACAPFEAAIQAERRASAAELEQLRRGRDADAWLRYYGTLRAVHAGVPVAAFLEDDRSSSFTTTATTTRAPDAESAADAAVLPALADQPEYVRVGAGESATTHVVYPKSGWALMQVHAHDLLLGQLVDALQHIRRLDPLGAVEAHTDTPELLDTVAELTSAIAYHQGILAWIALTPGCGLPFGDADVTPEVPAEVRALDPLALMLVNRAFVRVNWVRLRSLEPLIYPTEEGDDEANARRRLTWSTFYGSLAVELDRPVTELLRNQTLASLVASTRLAASEQRRATAEAKARAKAQRPGDGAHGDE